jgi:hypothetical protein
VWTAADDAEEKGDSVRLNIWSLGFAVADVEAAIVAFQLRKDPPAPIFSSANEQIELTGGEPDGISKINKVVRLRRSAARKARQSE